MKFIKKITNKNFKKLIKKSHKFNENVINELKRCLLIHHCTDIEDGTCSITYSKYGDKEVLYFFTDLEEYRKCYPTDDDSLPIWWYFSQIDDFLYEDTCGIIINPKSDNFYIPQDLLYHILQDEIQIQKITERRLGYFEDDILDRKKIYTPEELLNIENKRNNELLLKYIGDKKYFTQYTSLFHYFEYSYLYVLVQYDEALDFKKDYLKTDNGDIYKKDNFYMVFMDLDSLKDEINDRYCYYSVADMFYLTQIVLELDFEGIILNTGEREITLPRDKLLKNFDKIRMEYDDFSLNNAPDYVFEIR